MRECLPVTGTCAKSPAAATAATAATRIGEREVLTCRGPKQRTGHAVPTNAAVLEATVTLQYIYRSALAGWQRIQWKAIFQEHSISELLPRWGRTADMPKMAL